MKKLKAIIVEDDIYNQKAVESIIENHFQEIVIVDKAMTVKNGLASIEKHQPDLLILDINLPDGTSFDILQQCSCKNYKVVFMSAYHEYALEALRFSAIEFVYKPFDVNEIVVAIDKAIEEINDESYCIRIRTLFDNIDMQNKNKRLVLQSDEEIKVCEVNDIIWAEAIVGGANFYFDDGTSFFVDTPLRRYEAILNSHAFFRCHPHYLINLLRVKKINLDLSSILMSNNTQVELEERRYKQLLNAMPTSA